MTRFFGVVGYGETVEKSPGIFEDQVVEHKAYGHVSRNTRIFTQTETVHDDLVVNNSISIVMDAYSSEHFHNIRYVSWAGVRWKVTEVTEARPRLLLRLGGTYVGPTPDPSTP